MNDTAENTKLAEAKKQAKERDEDMAIVSIEWGDGSRHDQIVTLDEFDSSDELAAFDARLITIVYPDGTID